MRKAWLLLVTLLAAATPAQAQLFNFPLYSIRSGAPSTVLMTHYGRGLSDNTGKLNAYQVGIARAGIGRMSLRAGLGMIDATPDAQWTFGGAAQMRFNDAASPTAVTALAGVGYMSVDPASFLRFPIGVGFGRSFAGASATVSPWVMPRAEINRFSANGFSSTETDFGASGGVTIILPSGLGFHFALDLLAADESVWHAGGGVQYVIQ
jgi:hypothetical protein